jgi:hypothetical protein
MILIKMFLINLTVIIKNLKDTRLDLAKVVSNKLVKVQMEALLRRKRKKPKSIAKGISLIH